MQWRFNLRGVLIIAVVFFIFYGIYLYITLSNKPESAYSVLSRKQKVELQDTRVHNWSEINSKSQKLDNKNKK